MGHHRKGEDRGSVDRPGARNARIRRGKKSPPRNRNSGRKTSGGKVIPLRGQKRAGGSKRGGAKRGGAKRDANRARRVSSTSPEVRITVGRRRLWMVAAVFAVTGLL
ncbi:MAG: hypothetical protein ACRDN7_05485, partial [Rubrobacter sp.]